MKNLTNRKKISLSEFKETQLSVVQLGQLKGGGAPGVSECRSGYTSSSGADHDCAGGDCD